METLLVIMLAVFLSLFLFTDYASVEEKVNINDLDQLSIDLITEEEYNLNEINRCILNRQRISIICYAKKSFL